MAILINIYLFFFF